MVPGTILDYDSKQLPNKSKKAWVLTESKTIQNLHVVYNYLVLEGKMV